MDTIKFTLAAASVFLFTACGGGGKAGVAIEAAPSVSNKATAVNSSAGTVASTIILVMN